LTDPDRGKSRALELLGGFFHVQDAIRNALVNARNKKGLTVREVAAFTGISQSRLEEIEAGRRWITSSDFILLVFALGVSISEVLPEPSLSGVALAKLYKDIRSETVHLSAACGESPSLDTAESIRYYVVMKALEELDSQVKEHEHGTDEE